jgi:hypothetical protein
MRRRRQTVRMRTYEKDETESKDENPMRRTRQKVMMKTYEKDETESKDENL